MLGKPVPRVDMPSVVTARVEYVHNVRVPGMLHGRVVRPPTVGANLVNVDESSVKGMPGFVKVVVKKNFVGVVARKAVAGDPDRERAESDMEPGPGAAGSAPLLRVPSNAADTGHDLGRFGRRRRQAGECGHGAAIDLPPPVPDARLDRQLVRRGGRAGRTR